jgi:ABC-2 type transport system ATP-binding protein
MSDPPLQTEHLGRRYRRSRPWAVRDLSIVVPEGSITALVGPNGSGKSTLIRACLGFERPDAGRVLVFGADPRRQRATAVEAIGYIPQAGSLYRALSIGDHLTMAAAARPTFDRSYAAERLKVAGLSPRRRVGELSGGEQAQVALALALGSRAPLLLLDEPLASLDPLARREFLASMVVDLRRRGATAVVSSHLITDIDRICDRLVVLAHGQLALASSLDDAVATFRTAPADQLDGQTAVGQFSGPDGARLALVRGGARGQPATLEEIVLGHLAMARAEAEEAAA